MGRKKKKLPKRSPFGERIAFLRKEAGLTMTALSDKVAVTASYISLIESGERQPSREVVVKLADIFFGSDDLDAIDELLMLAGLSPAQKDKFISQDNILLTYQQRPQAHRVSGGNHFRPL